MTQLRALVLRHGVEDIAGSLIDTQARRAATGSSGVARSDEATLGVVGLHNHAGQGIIHAPVFNRWNVNLADLELFARPDHQLFSVLPRYRDRITFDVLARPRVYDGCKVCVASLGGPNLWVGILLLIVALPGVTNRVSGSGLSELLDFRIGQFRIEVQVSLWARSSNTEDFVGLVGNYLVNKGLTSIRGGNLSCIEVRAHPTSAGKAPISERAVLRIIKGDAQTPPGFVGAARARLQGFPAETSLATLRSVLRDNTRTGRQVGGFLGILLHRSRLVADAASERSGGGLGHHGVKRGDAQPTERECNSRKSCHPFTGRASPSGVVP